MITCGIVWPQLHLNVVRKPGIFPEVNGSFFVLLPPFSRVLIKLAFLPAKTIGNLKFRRCL